MAPHLPFELWSLICELLDNSSLKSLRASSRQFHYWTSPALFRTIRFNLDTGGTDRLVAISEHEVLREYVHSLVLRRDQGLYEFPDGFEAWESSIVQDARQSNPGTDGGFHGNTDTPTASPVATEWIPMSTEEWGDMDKDTRRRLYEEYEKDRIDLRENSLRLAHGIQSKPLGLLGGEGLVNDRVVGGNPEPSPSDRLDRAISRLPNLKQLSHEPAYLTDENWGMHWRRVSFNREKLLSNTTDKEEERAESLQVSLVLRALGLRQRLNKSLTHLKLYVAGSAFWGTNNLGRLWNPKSIQQTRGNCPILTIQDLDLEMEMDDLFELPLPTGGSGALFHNEQLTRELVTMEHSFVNLTDIQLEINCLHHNGSAYELAYQLYYFLREAGRLTNLSLIFKAEVFNHGEPNYSYPAYGEQHSEATSRLLRWLALDNCWPSIQTLQLSIDVGAEDLVHFLLGASQTLRHLTLESVAIAPGSKTWEDVFESLSSDLKLESFKFRCLEDNGIHGVRVIGEPTTPDWNDFENDLSCYFHYEDAIRNYVLGRSVEKPLLEPAQFLKHHMHVCDRAKTAVSKVQALDKEK